MKWIQALLLMVIGLSGCKSQAPLADPFGQTRIPPPPTGSMYAQPASSATPPVVAGPAVATGGAAYSTNPSYRNAPLTNAPAWVPPTAPGTTQPGLIPPPNQPSTTNYAGNTIPGTTASPPTNQLGVSAAPVGTPGAPPVSPTPASSPNFNYALPPGGSSPSGVGGAGVFGGYRPPSDSRRSDRPFFNGGVPDRRTIPVSTTSPRPIDNAGGVGMLGWSTPLLQGCPPAPSNCTPIVSSCNPPQAGPASLAPLQPVPDAVSSSPVAPASYVAQSNPAPTGTPKPAPP